METNVLEYCHGLSLYLCLCIHIKIYALCHWLLEIEIQFCIKTKSSTKTIPPLPPSFDPTILFLQKLLYEIVDVYILESVKRISSAIITSCVQHTIWVYSCVKPVIGIRLNSEHEKYFSERYFLNDWFCHGCCWAVIFDTVLKQSMI